MGHPLLHLNTQRENEESGSIKPPLMTRDDMATMKYTSLPTESSTLKGKCVLLVIYNGFYICEIETFIFQEKQQ